VILSDAEKEEAARERNEMAHIMHIDGAAQVTVSTDEKPTTSTPPTDSGDSDRNAGVESINNFRNVYIHKPFPAMLKDHLGIWYNIPWRVAQSFEVSQSSGA
jgi:hypothetical protein